MCLDLRNPSKRGLQIIMVLAFQIQVNVRMIVEWDLAGLAEVDHSYQSPEASTIPEDCYSLFELETVDGLCKRKQEIASSIKPVRSSPQTLCQEFGITANCCAGGCGFASCRRGR